MRSPGRARGAPQSWRNTPFPSGAERLPLTVVPSGKAGVTLLKYQHFLQPFTVSQVRVRLRRVSVAEISSAQGADEH